MKHITKISTLIIALTLAMSASAASGIDWNAIGWVSENGNTAYAQKYKVSQDNGQPNIVNIQNKDGQLAIYVHVPAAITECSVSSVIGGAGIWLHLSAFTAQETQVTIKYDAGNKSCTFWVYYADGSGDAGDSGDSGDSGDEEIVESNYCSKELTSQHSKTIQLTAEKVSDGNYRLIIEGEELKDVTNGVYYYPNKSVTNEHVQLKTKKSASSTTEKLIYEFEATDPYIYTPLYVLIASNEENNFGALTDIIWGTCSATPEPIYNSISESICFGETYTWNGQTYSTAGEYTQEFTAVNGADSIVTLTLTVYPQTPDVTEDATIDFGETYTWHNQEYTETGTYTITLQDANGCDYQATLNLTVNSNSPSTPSTCTYEGGPGDALMEQPGKDQFKSGYRITLTLDEADPDKIHITATVFDDDAPASSACFQNYPDYDYSKDTNEKRFEGSTQNTFETTISISSLISNRADGIIRFAIKFEYPDGVIKVTTPEFFYLDGSGCAQRVFAIYHHDDLPATPLKGEDQFTEFAGGKILQSIQYKRRMPSEVWETLSVPFDVDSVTAFDPATGKHVRLNAQYNNGSTQKGNYWLRYFKTKEVTASNFQPNWYDIEATSKEAAKPVKDKAYIIRLPNGGGYYNDKYIVFHGRGYQTIVSSSDFEVPELPAEDYYSYSGNNTMMPQYLSSAYVLDNAGYYFTSSSTVTLYPFEWSVNATASTIARMPRIALNGRNNTTTDLTLLPTTDLQGGVIYSIFGAAVARFNTIDEYDQACQTLAAGVYVVVTPSATTKIQIP